MKLVADNFEKKHTYKNINQHDQLSFEQAFY